MQRGGSPASSITRPNVVAQIDQKVPCGAVAAMRVSASRSKERSAVAVRPPCQGGPGRAAASYRLAKRLEIVDRNSQSLSHVLDLAHRPGCPV